MNTDNSVSNEAARKRISRIGKNIFSVRGMFSNGQKMFFHRDIYQTETYWFGLRESLEKAGKQYSYIIDCLEFHYGSISLEQLASYTCNPILKTTGHLSFETAITKLINLQIISINEDYVYLSPSITSAKTNHRHSKGLEVAKSFLLLQFNDWARKIGLISYNSSKFHSHFGNYQFNLVSPSYISSLTKQKDNMITPAFLIADILIGNTINTKEINFFVNKINALKSRKNTPHFLPFLIVDNIENEALNKLKANGIIIGFTEQLFGTEYKEMLDSLINLVTNAGAILKKNPEAYLELIGKINKLVDGKTNNLRGDLFELAIGYYHGQFAKSIDISKNIIFEGQHREIDVLSFFPDKIIISECKGYNRKISKDDLEIWLSEKVYYIRKWILDQNFSEGKEIVFEFWSTGGFTNEAEQFIQERQKTTRKYQLIAYNLDQMVELARKNRLKKLTEILRNYYVKEL